ncbi:MULTISPECIES: type VI secretion system lipoprotein TssJ [unclassified Variovorax]|uniref:type VI secretion system lipoprotein TssJ n=1 Tax=unclassified Variovorax TaxID=663243 RepID=UPI0013165F74|nr:MULTISPECIES: type VI secretion system lipoprotein TssJ [unclassified Variovorax]VTU31890.1 type VI secretion lipoprotein, family [Variovorax sp. SRS16]VTU38863.1 type VI secretion lipoprotein, family [Variovorax sp. PBL-E5]
MRAPGTRRSPYGRFAIAWHRRAFGAAALLSAGLLLAACGSPPPKPVVTQVSITLAAGTDANPDARGRASPLTVRVYALKTTGAFEAADFFSLFEKDQATLGAEMIQREEVLLRPGESKKIEMTLQPDAKAIGVMAAYRDLDHARWREVRALEVGKPLNLGLNFGARQIRVEAK